MTTAAEMIRNLPKAFDASAAQGTDCTIQFNCSTPMHVIIKNGTCTTGDGTAANSDLAITMEDDDLVALHRAPRGAGGELVGDDRRGYAGGVRRAGQAVEEGGGSPARRGARCSIAATRCHRPRTWSPAVVPV